VIRRLLISTYEGAPGVASPMGSSISKQTELPDTGEEEETRVPYASKLNHFKT
jgi:hypothetical protein